MPLYFSCVNGFFYWHHNSCSPILMYDFFIQCLLKFLISASSFSYLIMLLSFPFFLHFYDLCNYSVFRCLLVRNDSNCCYSLEVVRNILSIFPFFFVSSLYHFLCILIFIMIVPHVCKLYFSKYF